jgi:hypothetical protein
VCHDERPASATRHENWTLAALIALAFVCRIWHMTAVCLDGDEIFSLLVSRQDWAAMTSAIAADAVHPPLFYYLLHLWLQLGNESLLWLRLLPVAISIIAIAPFIWFCRESGLRPREINFAVGAMALHPYLIYYSQHLRMYCLLMLFGFLSYWLLARASRGSFAVLTAVNIVLVYCHYYGWLLVAIECAYIVIWRRRYVRQALLSFLVVLLAFIPWVWVAARAVRAPNIGWIPRPGFLDLIGYFSNLAGCDDFRTFGPILAVGIYILIVLSIYVQRQRKWLLELLVAGPVMLAFAASWMLPHSVWGHRHLVFIAAPFLALWSIACCRPQGRALRIGVVALFSIWIAQAAAYQIRRDDKKLPWDAFVLELLAREDKTSVPVRFYTTDPYLHYPVSFYLQGLASRALSGFATPVGGADLGRLSREAGLFEVRKVAALGEAAGDHFWIGYSPNPGEGEPPERAMQRRGCTVGSAVSGRDRYHEVRAFPVWCYSKR